MQIVLIKKPNQKTLPKHTRFVWACFTFNLRDEKWLMVVESFWGDQIDAEKTQGSRVKVLGFPKRWSSNVGWITNCDATLLVRFITGTFSMALQFPKFPTYPARFTEFPGPTSAHSSTTSNHWNQAPSSRKVAGVDQRAHSPRFARPHQPSPPFVCSSSSGRNNPNNWADWPWMF